jgi:hypothetical protein
MKNIIYNQHQLAPTFIAQIQLGNAALHCERFGICKLLTLNEKSCEQCKKNTILTRITIINECFVFVFLKKQMTASLFEKHFASAFFIMEDDFRIHRKKAKAFGLMNEMLLLKGFYPITEKERTLKIAIPYIMYNDELRMKRNDELRMTNNVTCSN